MRVSELIKKLRSFDQDAIIRDENDMEIQHISQYSYGDDISVYLWVDIRLGNNKKS